MVNDRLWENLYWISESTRPDRLATVLGSIFHKENGANKHFIYDREAAKDVMEDALTQDDHSQHHIDSIDLQQRDFDHFNPLKPYSDRTHLTPSEKQHLIQFDNLVHLYSRVNSLPNIQSSHNETKSGFEQFRAFSHSDLDVVQTDENHLNKTQIDQDTQKRYPMSRKAVEKFLHEFFNSVHLVGDIIKPRPINARLVKMGKFNTNTKLFSKTVLVQTRSNVHALPLRCKSGDAGDKSKISLTDRIDQIESILLNLDNHVSTPTT